jgi:hypothetical protein
MSTASSVGSVQVLEKHGSCSFGSELLGQHEIFLKILAISLGAAALRG